MSEKIETIGSALPKEIGRVKELHKDYVEIGRPGLLAQRMMEADIDYAEKALKAADPAKMAIAHEALQRWTA